MCSQQKNCSTNDAERGGEGIEFLTPQLNQRKEELAEEQKKTESSRRLWEKTRFKWLSTFLQSWRP